MLNEENYWNRKSRQSIKSNMQNICRFKHSMKLSCYWKIIIFRKVKKLLKYIAYWKWKNSLNKISINNNYYY